MEFDAQSPTPLAFPSASLTPIKCHNCGCSCSLSAGSSSWFRSVKRKYDEFEIENSFFIPGLDLVLNPRVQIDNELTALREAVSSQQQAIQDLYAELEQERNAASSAANEAMSMILRLQREKAEIQMEARQFKRYAEEKMAHDMEEVAALEDLLFKREQAVQSLTCEVQAYKHRMLSYGLPEAEINGDKPGLDSPFYDYPPLKCPSVDNPNHSDGEENIDIEKYAFGETPRGKETLKNIEYRIYQLESSPSEKVIVGQSPRRRHSRRLSTDSSSSLSTSLKKTQYLPQKDDMSDMGDDVADRVYTVDSVYNSVKPEDGFVEDADIKKLFSRLQALEADRESMRQAIVSMRTDKAQLVLLKEIAQQLCKDMSPPKPMPVKKRPVVGSFSFVNAIKMLA